MSAPVPAAHLHHTPGRAAGAAQPAVHELVVDRAGERLDVFLARALPDCSRSAAQRLIDEGLVTVGGRRERASFRLPPGVAIRVELPAPRPSALEPEPMAIPVVYEDDDLLVVDKPAGLVVHPAAGHERGTLVHGLLALTPGLSGIGSVQRPGIVHRLDRDTSGLLVIAKNDRAHAALTRQFAERSVSKHYLAVLCGRLQSPEGLIDAPLGRDPVHRQRMAVVERGRPARTAYHTLDERAGHPLVVVRLHTGRTHQIRVHFAALGCPIGGDPLYGNRGGIADRLWLHAWRLGFDRPSDGERVTLEAQPPHVLVAGWDALPAGPASEPFARLLARARRWAAGAEQKKERQVDP